MAKMNWDKVRREESVRNSLYLAGKPSTAWATKRCQAKTAKGLPCKNSPEKGYRFCGPHN